ncbi:MAG: lipoyl(octanoyl) transferase LipB [Polyangia bacterium]
MQALDLGRRGFGEVEALQVSLRARVIGGDVAAEALLVVEHEPVVTLGRRGGSDGLLVPEAQLRSAGVELYTASRGGEATYHGPGQLVAYPVMTLRRGVVAHVEALACAAIRTAAHVGVEARFDRARPGVWVEDRKLASIGVHVHRRVTMHGIALNVDDEVLVGFQRIVPCGMPGVTMTSLEREVGRKVDVREVFTTALLEALSA